MSKPPSTEQLALQIVQKLQRGGHVAYFAGGCVRDRILARVPNDYDVATSAHPEVVAKLFPHSQLVGAAFGVVLVRNWQEQVEVATFRADAAYSDGRHPDAVRYTNAEEDAKRRDFTCNGLFFDPVANALHDFVGGETDIHNRVLRAIGDPYERFSEDHLRMLRAIRFAGKLRFTIEPNTWQAMRARAERIREISRERIGEEVRLILEHPSRMRGFRLLALADLVGWIWPPELLEHVTPALAASHKTRFQSLQGEVPRAVALVAFQRDLWTERKLSAGEWQAAGEQFQRYFMLSNQERDDIAWLATKVDVLREQRPWTRRVVKRLMADPRWAWLHTLHLAEVRGPDAAFDEFVTALAQEGVAPEPLVSGEDLIALGAAPGPKFKSWLETLYDRQLENELATREAALAAARALVVSKA